MKSIIVKKEYLPSIAHTDRFINAVQLGRIVGAIRCNNILQGVKVGDDESSVNLRIYLLLNHAALLFEGIKNFNNARPDYEDLAYYREHSDKIGILLGEFGDLSSFSHVVLKPIRNKIAFHFDKDVITSILQSMVEDSIKENKDIVLISGRSSLVKDTVYSLADNVNINYVLKSLGEESTSDEDKFKIFARKLLELSSLFCEIIDELIPDLIIEYCELKEEKEA